MAKNIYDLFNERKYGVDYLVEGYDFDEDSVVAYESLDAAIEAINEFTQESMDETIEFQSAAYLETLVIENMMFTDFDESKISAVITESIGDRIQTAKEKVQHWWKKMKEWFVGTFKAIANHFKSGETLVRENNKKINEAMARSHVKVKMNKYKDLDAGMKGVFNMIDKIKENAQTNDSDKDDARSQILDLIACSDKKDVVERVRGCFIEDEKVEQEISSINPEVAKKFAGQKSKVIDGLKKQQKPVDESFRKILQDLQELERKSTGEDRPTAEKMLNNFNFALQIKNLMLSTQMNVIKKACSDYTVVIRRALSYNYNKRADKKHNKTLESFMMDDEEIEFLED